MDAWEADVLQPSTGETASAAWLTRNRLDADLVAFVLAVAAPLDGSRSAQPAMSVRFHPDSVRALCEHAYAEAWPAHCEAARHVCASAPVDFVQSDDVRPHTVDRGASELPAIVVPWRTGCAAEALSLAHELAHAVQIVATHAKTPNAAMPPVAREVCAFLGERALLSRCAGEAELAALHVAYADDDQTYLVSDAGRLSAALAAAMLTHA